MKKAFTLIELVFVITVLGIVVGVSMEHIAMIYDDLIQKDEVSRIDDSVESAIDTIDKMLSSSIKESIVMIRDGDYSVCKSIHEQGLSGVNTLAWVGVEKYGMSGGLQGGYYMPFWSGVVDLSLSDYDSITDPLADFAKEMTAIADMSDAKSMAVYFDGSSTNSCYDFFQNGGASMFEVVPNGQKLSFKSKKPSKISQKYYLSHTGYAITLDGENLNLHYDFVPWQGQGASSGKVTLLASSISSFGVSSDGGVIRVNICSSALSSTKQKICKERAIF